MDGSGIMTQSALKAAAYERDLRESGLRAGRDHIESNAISSQATLSGLIPSTDELLGLLAELGSRLDRVEVAIAGPSVVDNEPAAGTERSLSCITDIVDDRLSRARMVVSRLHNTVSRIERRIG